MSFIKKFRPITPSLRHREIVNKTSLDPSTKGMKKGLNKLQGRNSQGRISVRHRGGGARRLLRSIRHDYIGEQLPREVLKIEYDPNRSSFISYQKHYSLMPIYSSHTQSVSRGAFLYSGKGVPLSDGNCLPLQNIPVGKEVTNVEASPGKGPVYCRSAGCVATVQSKSSSLCSVKLPSGVVLQLSHWCSAVLGKVSNESHVNRSLGKAGASRWVGKRPSVRGVAMNPVDHPHGGGEGKTSGGRPSVTFKGFYTKGRKTSKKNRN